jgi:hypothetical protein
LLSVTDVIVSMCCVVFVLYSLHPINTIEKHFNFTGVTPPTCAPAYGTEVT